MPNVSVWRRLGMASAVGLWILALVSSVGAQVPREEPRLALLIGNSAYRESPLRNPVNDVRAMAQRFKDLGFTVLVHENATKRTMEAAIIEFGRRLTEGGVGAFYYAGHGLQVRGRNYLVRSTPRSRTRHPPASPPSTWSCCSSRWPRRRTGSTW